MLKFFTYLEIPVNLTHYRGSVDIFNIILFLGQDSQIIGHKCWSAIHFYVKEHLPIFPMNLVLFFVFVIGFFFSPSFNFHLTSRNTFASMLVITVALLFNYLWFMYNILLLCGDVELNPAPNQNIVKNLLFATRTLIA